MPATVTLSSTTITEGVDASATRIKVASTTGLVYGVRLYIDGELMSVQRLDVDPWVIVTRGVDGSRASAHSDDSVVYIGRADQFYDRPPIGRPDAAVLVSPYIDVVNGNVYFAQGDVTPSGSAVRWWQIQTNTRNPQPLGVIPSVLNLTSGT
jgi:hypothetical protein